MTVFPSETCCFTGHRDIPAWEEQKILTRVRYHLWPLLRNGVKYFVVGGAIGFDTIVAEYLLDQRDREGTRIRIISFLPYPGWREKWAELEIRRQDRILERCDKVSYAQQAFSEDVYLLRDRLLVDGSGYCISYCNRLTGGTAYTVRYALQQGLKVYNASSWDLRQLGVKDSSGNSHGFRKEPSRFC